MTTVYNIDLGIPKEETFSIANKALKLDTEEQIDPIIKDLKNFKVIKKLDISGNTFSPLASKKLVENLTEFQKDLVDVNLQDIYVSRDKDEIPASLKEFFPFFLNCPNLRVLNLSDNAFGQDTIEVLEDFISKAVSLEHLILTNNGLGPFSGARIGKALYNLSKAKSLAQDDSKTTTTTTTTTPISLKTFWCGRNRLENGSIDYLSIGLRSHKNLEEVKLYQNGIRPLGIAKLITHGLSKIESLKTIDLQDNTFTIKGSVALANSIGNWENLVELNINDCLLKPKGCLNFIESLKILKFDSNIKILKLQYNELDSESLQVLSAILNDKLPNLTKLELDGNRFDEDDEYLVKIQDIFEERGAELDELEDLEEPDSDEEDEDEDEDEEEEGEGDGEGEDEDKSLDELEKELAAAHI
ncbi:unnamed protein product [[Candida] boidinii]|uniref:Unnamed protein product n=1 Tax=Candida boidinii TaxID=5477 RepID=A0A9W6W914_CANBO|nr:hypothetical protein B5S30_g2873 [[Candida] boidinii]GME69101.1 unnamed protein product [[Candida] boidinii]GMF97921.1 unnamed protein product [[Candida] boidinii]